MFWARVDLPTPLGPTRTALPASLRKSRAIRASMAARSQRLGQVQSKSQSGLKGPIWAACRRRSRRGRWLSWSSQSSNGGSQSAAATSGQCASSPCRCSASARARSACGSVIGDILEAVIGCERVRLHRCITGLNMLGQHDGDRRWGAVLLTLAVEREAHGVGVRHVALERLLDGGLQGGGAVPVEQLQQRGGDAAERHAASGRAAQQLLAGRSGLGETVGGPVLAGRALFRDQRIQVIGLLDLRALVIAAAMAGEQLPAIDDAPLL